VINKTKKIMNTRITKIQLLLRSRGLTQTDLFNLIKDSKHKNIGQDRINKLVLGNQKNYTIETAKTLADVLGVKLDDIVE
jgi:transcriptional regulator with XRE-family HTH domain